MFCVAFSQDGFDVSFTKQLAMGLGVVTTISLHALRTLARAAAFSTYRTNAVDQWDQLSDIMRVGACQYDG